jgi:hypothetical protein
LGKYETAWAPTTRAVMQRTADITPEMRLLAPALWFSVDSLSER